MNQGMAPSSQPGLRVATATGKDTAKSLHHSQTPIQPAEAIGRLFELAALLGDSIDRGLADQGLTRARAEVIWRLGRAE